MAEKQIRTFNISLTLIDSTDTVEGEKLVDELIKKVEEIAGIRVQSINSTLVIQTPDSTVSKQLLAIQTTDDSLKILQVPDNPPPETQN